MSTTSPAVLPSVQRHAGPHHDPSEEEPPVQRVADPAAAAIRAGIARSDGSGGVVFAAPADEGSPDPLGGAPAMSGVSAVPGVPAGTAVQRQGAPAEAPAPSAAPAAPAAAPTAGGGAVKGGSPGELDDLARKLYDRIRGRLVAELRVDRERAGMASGLR